MLQVFFARSIVYANPRPDRSGEGFVFAPAGIVDMLTRFVFPNAFQFEFLRKPHRKETLQLEVQLLGLISLSGG